MKKLIDLTKPMGQQVFDLSFSQALDATKDGYSVSRDKWKGGEFLYMGKGSVPNDINDIYYRYDMDFYVIGDKKLIDEQIKKLCK